MFSHQRNMFWKSQNLKMMLKHHVRLENVFFGKKNMLHLWWVWLSFKGKRFFHETGQRPQDPGPPSNMRRHRNGASSANVKPTPKNKWPELLGGGEFMWSPRFILGAKQLSILIFTEFLCFFWGVARTTHGTQFHHEIGPKLLVGNMSKCILSNVFVQSNLGFLGTAKSQVTPPRKQGAVLVRSMTVQMPSQGIHGNWSAISDSSILRVKDQ